MATPNEIQTASVAASSQAKKLYVAFSSDGTMQIGTCRHCVVEEKGRTPDATDPDPHRSELDFPLDDLLCRLARRGIRAEVTDQFVCP